MEIISNMIEAHICRVNKKGYEFLILKRAKNEIYPNLWQMVTGSVIQNETAVQAVIRELKEETNLLPKKIWVVPNVNSFYNPNKDSITLIPVFLVLVDNESEVKISDEHYKYKWVKNKVAKKLMAWQGQKLSLDIINSYLKKLDTNLKFVEVEL